MRAGEGLIQSIYTDSHGQKFTNKFEYPLAVVMAVLNDTYDRGDCEFSATGLLEPPRIRVLKERHKDEITLDIDDRVFILYGKMGHSILEMAGRGIGKGHVETRYFGDVGGTRISAQIDSLDLEEDGTLTDYKFTTVYGFKDNAKPKDDWIKQMNIQLELLRQNGLDAKRLRIWGMLRDWRPRESMDARFKGKKYPSKIDYHEIPMADRPRTVAMIQRTIDAHHEAKVTLPECTSDENWNGNRCSGYCDVSEFCEQYQRKKAKK